MITGPRVPPSFVCITAPIIRHILDAQLPRCLSVIAEAYATHARRDLVDCPRSSFVRPAGRPGCRIIALPASLGPAGPNGIKWIASYPPNTRRGLDRASAVVILNCAETGYPVACLEGSLISAARTAASAVLVLERLKGKKLSTLGIIGAGLIAQTVYDFLLRLDHEIDEVRVHDLQPEAAGRFAAHAAATGRHREVRVVPAAAALGCEAVVLATIAAEPHILEEGALAHGPLVLHLSLRDLSPDIILGAYNVVDDANHVLSANTSLHLAQIKQGGDASFIHATAAEILGGTANPPAAGPAIVFSPFGLGTLDVALAAWIHQEAIRTGSVAPVADFHG